MAKVIFLSFCTNSMVAMETLCYNPVEIKKGFHSTLSITLAKQCEIKNKTEDKQALPSGVLCHPLFLYYPVTATLFVPV